LVERIGRKLELQLDLDNIFKIARSFKTNFKTTSDDPTAYPNSLLEKIRDEVKVRRAKTVRIGILRDRAFNFYYPENFEALVNEGAELFFIDSFKDRLPKVDGLYIGGGFPEFFLKELEGSRSLRHDIAEAVQEGLPVYAECAGVMYLCRSISWQNRSYEMVGIIPAEVQLSEKPEGHGYVVAEVMSENPIFPVGLTIRGHEFHHSSLVNLNGLQFAYRILRGQGMTGKRDGIVYKNLFASYIHLHALGTPEWAKGFVSLASKEKSGSRGIPNAKEGASLG
jgi:cobyrinic acid a,c-diamide synthase